eukprot:GEZU01019627.1.p1 GENE.GEZU01019627.1~~GEZU01019627.1.p1  ORF type:complete len:566 (-),score=88.16 GEZU01019627.1:574-2271(-)
MVTPTVGPDETTGLLRDSPAYNLYPDSYNNSPDVLGENGPDMPLQKSVNIDIDDKNNTRCLVKRRRCISTAWDFVKFFGPAVLVSVGYVDPGNWATDIEGGSRFGYSLLWVILFSNTFALILQTLCARLGLVTGKDLALHCRYNYSKLVAYILWILTELAIVSTDLAEVIGTALGLNLLFRIPLIWAVVVTALDTLLFLVITAIGPRFFEALIITLMGTISICFIIDVFFAKPNFKEVMSGFIPMIKPGSMYLVTGILGATIMPHNLYLHSGVIQSRQPAEGSKKAMKRACRFAFLDSLLALNVAFLVNAAILIVSAAAFWKHGIVVVAIQDAYKAIENLFNSKLAAIVFGIALLCAGQSSTMTGTLAGQIVMEGFVELKMKKWLRRLITRGLAIIPAAVVVMVLGEKGTTPLLVWSQVILSLQLPFAMVPLIRFTSSASIMGIHKSKIWVQILAWLCVIIITGLNVYLVYDSVTTIDGKAAQIGVGVTSGILGLLLSVLLVYITIVPLKTELTPVTTARLNEQEEKANTPILAQEDVNESNESNNGLSTLPANVPDSNNSYFKQ